MKTIVDINTGKLLYATNIEVELQSNEIIIDEILTNNFTNPYFDFNTRTFYEGPPINVPKIVPLEISLWRIRTILKLKNKETEIETAIAQLNEPTKTAASSVWQFGTVIERYSQTILLIQSVLLMSDEEVDDLFIEANSIIV
jgi:hypothetical protein